MAWQMYGAAELEAETQATIAATIEAGDTLSDALWNQMRGEAQVKLAA